MREGIAALGLVVVFLGPLAAPSHGATTGTGAVRLAWTAPGDDGLTGRAKEYDLRRSTMFMTPSSFLSAARVTLPAPSAPGTRESFVVAGLDTGKTYYFAVRTSDDAGNWSPISNEISRVASINVTDVGEPAPILSFSVAWPNPARQSASFDLELPVEGRVSVEAFDLSGRRVRTLTSGSRAAGHHRVVWDLRDDAGQRVKPGIYLVRLTAGRVSFTRRVVAGH